jgi:hypothetical protein
MGRPRNNITKLAALTRLRICELLDDGAEYNDIRQDSVIAEECSEKGLTLHNRSFLAYRESEEFDEYRKRRREWQSPMRRNKIAAMFVESEDAPDDIARLANYKLLQICLDKLDSGEDLTEKEVRAISSAVSNYNRNRIAEEKEDGKRAAADREAVYQAEIAKLTATIEAQAERLRNLAGDIDGAAVADAMNKNLGLNT